jgi:hypothetical protein
MSFVIPLFLSGLALLAWPWFVHRIRRPEREAVKFSSLMFVPQIKRETIERRRIQNVFLMVLRMLLLALLTLAFARPFREGLLAPHASAEGATHHVILLDASASMGAEGVWQKARIAALAVLDDMKPGDRVGVIRFAKSARVDLPLTEEGVLARRVIDEAQLTWEKGNVLSGLQAAADMVSGDGKIRRVVHLVSDFQATGMPTSETGWALPARIRLHPIVIGKGDWDNKSVEVVALRTPGQKALQVRARIRNWQGPEDATVHLWIDDQRVDSKRVSVSPRHASLVRFDVPNGAHTGFVDIQPFDGLAADNRRYFTHEVSPRQKIVVQRSGRLDRLLSAAVPAASELPWQISVVAEQDLMAASFEAQVVVVGRVSAQNAAALRAFVQDGGQVWVALQRGAILGPLNEMLAGSGVQVEAPASENRKAPVAWVNLKHRIFYPFRGAKFNDFSAIRYSEYHRLIADEDKVLAHFEGDEPMMAEGQLGHGRVLVWAGGVEMDRSNLARSPRFVALIHETLRYLAGAQADRPALDVGDLVGGQQVKTPGVHSGLIGSPIAVNIDVREGDPNQVSSAELEIRLCESPNLYREGESHTAADVLAGVKKEEYGPWILLLLLVSLFIEHVCAARIESHPRQEHI